MKVILPCSSAAYGDDRNCGTDRVDEGEEARFRRFTRAEIAARGDNLDISWLKDTSGDPEDGLDTPEDIASAIEGHLTLALEEVRALVEELDEGAVDGGGGGVIPLRRAPHPRRHCEERSDAAIQKGRAEAGLPRVARNDGVTYRCDRGLS